jgi:hypothetical protein
VKRDKVVLDNEIIVVKRVSLLEKKSHIVEDVAA